MKIKDRRLEAIKMIISSKELGSQEDVLAELKREGFTLTQATLSRDFKQLKVAKAASMNGQYVYVLPNETMYKRVRKPMSATEMMQTPGFLSINFSGNIGVIRPRPGDRTCATAAQCQNPSHILNGIRLRPRMPSSTTRLCLLRKWATN